MEKPYLYLTTESLKQRTARRYRKDGLKGIVKKSIEVPPTKIFNEARYRYVRDILLDGVLHQEDFKQYSKANGEFTTLNLQEIIDLPPEALSGKIDFGTQAPDYATAPYMHKWSTELDPYVAKIPNARLIGPDPLAVTSEGKIIYDTIYHESGFDSKFVRQAVGQLTTNSNIKSLSKNIKNLIDRPHKDYVDETYEAACLLTNRMNNYGHWTTEHILKLRLLERYEKLTGIRPKLLIGCEYPYDSDTGNDIPDYKKEYLDLLGYSDDWVSWTGGTATVKELIVPSFPHPTPDACQWLRSKLLNQIGNGDSESLPSRIYVSRKNARFRKVVNYEEVMDTLSSYGFEECVLEEMSVENQVKLFSNADFIIGPSGSGLVNIIFCDSNTSLLEIASKSSGSTYYQLTKILGINQRFMFGRPIEVQDLQNVNGKPYNIRIDIDNLEENITEML